MKVISSCGSHVLLLSSSDLEVTTLTRVKKIRNPLVYTEDVPRYWTVQLHCRTKSLPVYSYNHTL